MSEHPKINAFNAINSLSIIDQIELLEELNGVLMESTNDLKELDVKCDQGNLLEKLLFQVIFHNKSIQSLVFSQNLKFRGKEIELTDLSAIYSLVRLQIETYLNLSYIFFTVEDYGMNAKAIVYKIQGLRRQLELLKHHPKSKPEITLLRKELSQELRELRKTSDYFKASKSFKRKLEKPFHARLVKLEDVYKSIGIGDLGRLHQLYSNHIHAEYISIRQLIASLANPEERKGNVYTCLILCSRMTANIISNLENKFLKGKGKFSSESIQLKEKVKMLNEISRKL